MYFKVFAYGHDWQGILEFIKWWLRSENWNTDIKEGDKVDGGSSVRDITHTILIRPKGRFELIIEKGVIFSDDDSPRKLKDGELYFNKPYKKGGNETGFDIVVKRAATWLEGKWDCDPCEVNPEKADRESLNFDMVGIGFYIENPRGEDERDEWGLRIKADVVGIPK